MNKIKLLSPHEAQKIAAGEVVERPASVIKELLENALDAGATAVTLYIEKAGKQLIRIVDNGCGMSADDARLCFLPHATSKITTLEDLDFIQTFGFRGEALASISSVSKVTLRTRLNPLLSAEPIDEHQPAVELEYHDGQLQAERAVAAPVGTDIAIADLFYNTPVRKKFLKADETEWNQIQSFVYALTLSHWSVHVKLYHDGKMVLNAPITQKLEDRVLQLWDYTVASHLLPLATSHEASGFVADAEGITLNGAISNHQLWRYNRAQMFFFVNGRWVKNNDLAKAVFKGYANILPQGKFPATFIFITVDPKRVDVNIHPRKEEVRFLKPGMIEQALTNAVKKTLEQQVNNQLSGPAITERPYEKTVSFADQPITRHTVHSSLFELSEPRLCEERLDISHIGQPFNDQVVQPVVHAVTPPAHDEKIASSSVPAFIESPRQRLVLEEAQPLNLIGQLMNTYILVEAADGLVVVDQHAAHERILYEKYGNNFDQHEGVRLMFPQMVQLHQHQLKLVLERADFLLQQGIELEKFGADQVVVYTTPPHVQQCNVTEIVREMAAFLEDHESLDRQLFRKKLNEHLHGQLACKGAVKAGDVLTVQQMKQLLADLETVDHRFICVHGRPTMWKISQKQLEKQFQRIS